jgi:hypothetical protein
MRIDFFSSLFLFATIENVHQQLEHVEANIDVKVSLLPYQEKISFQFQFIRVM